MDRDLQGNRVADVSLTQWLALIPADIVADALKLPLSVVEDLEKDKQVLLHGGWLLSLLL